MPIRLDACGHIIDKLNSQVTVKTDGKMTSIYAYCGTCRRRILVIRQHGYGAENTVNFYSEEI